MRFAKLHASFQIMFGAAEHDGGTPGSAMSNFMYGYHSDGLGKSGSDLMIAGNVFNGIAFVTCLSMLLFLNKKIGYLWTAVSVIVCAFIAMVLLFAGAACVTVEVLRMKDASFPGYSMDFSDGTWLAWASAAVEAVATGLFFYVIAAAIAM